MINIGMKGFLRLQCVNRFSGKITQDTGWFPNTILTAGRNIMADFNFTTYCQVGTNSTVPTANDTTLPGYIDGTSNIVAQSDGQSGSAPYYGWKRKTFRIAPGLIGGENLQEAGIGWAVSGATLISRALILDPILQTPTVITPLVDEFLDVSYELRYYSPTVDVVGPQVVLDGVTYNTLTRAANVSGAFWSNYIGEKIGVYAHKDYWVSYDGDIGTVLTGPSGVGKVCDGAGQFNSAYNSNSYEVKMTCPAGATAWNQDIRSILISTRAGQFQTQFNAVGTVDPLGKIPKNTNYAMLMEWTIGWTALT